MSPLMGFAGIALMLAVSSCAGKPTPPAAVCPVASLPVYDTRPEVAGECKPMYDLCAEWRTSAINLCSE